MPGVYPTVAVHRLYVDPHYKPIKQKKRTSSEEIGKAIREVVDKLQGAYPIRELLFTTWLLKVVLVPKSNGIWQMCTTSPALIRHVQRIATLFPTSMDFLDAFLGYHQLLMVEDDVEKTIFVTELSRRVKSSSGPRTRRSRSRNSRSTSNPHRCWPDQWPGMSCNYIWSSQSQHLVVSWKGRRPRFNRVIRGAETRYPQTGKLVYALIVAPEAQAYFDAQPVEVVTDYPL
ncbi:hypothetical protein LIER_08544 [Lithospermum erythrorhizon]|uniref:Reverse transcriptase RNase H-like domain-containing protein n=1 Tax=Lithospermum erythrorhizon TaxID=34254 RepID=A0AAV3PDJ4_LITER